MKRSNHPLFSAFYMYDAESLENCTTYDDQYMIMVYNFKTTSYNKHCNLDDNLLFMYTVMSIPLTTRMKPGLQALISMTRKGF